MIGRRPLFFLVISVVAVALFPLTPGEFRLANVITAGVAFFWAVLLGIEEIVARRQGVLPPGVVEPRDVFRDEREGGVRRVGRGEAEDPDG
jgi:hypothetical protein